MKFRVEHTFSNISLADYEQLYFDEELNMALCREVDLERKLLVRNVEGDTIHREVWVAPKRELPGAVAKIIGSNRLEYTEHVDYTFGSMHGTWRTVSGVMTDKVHSAGTFGFEERGGKVLRWLEGEVKVKIFGVGAVVERFIVSDVEKSYDNAAAFSQKWIDHKG